MDVNKHATINQLKEGDKVVTDKTEIVELFNSFFVTQPLKLLGIQSVNILSSGSLQRIKDLREITNASSLTIPHITQQEILSSLQNMLGHKPTRIDGLGAKILKAAGPKIASPLSRLINNTPYSKMAAARKGLVGFAPKRGHKGHFNRLRRKKHKHRCM